MIALVGPIRAHSMNMAVIKGREKTVINIGWTCGRTSVQRKGSKMIMAMRGTIMSTNPRLRLDSEYIAMPRSHLHWAELWDRGAMLYRSSTYFEIFVGAQSCYARGESPASLLTVVRGRHSVICSANPPLIEVFQDCLFLPRLSQGSPRLMSVFAIPLLPLRPLLVEPLSLNSLLA